MLFPSTESWEDEIKLEGLLFFALRLQELSYDQSDFIEKSNTAPVVQIIKEYEEIIEIAEQDIVKGTGKELDILKEELKEKIYSDTVAKVLIGDKLHRYISSLDSGTLKNVKTTLELLGLKLDPHKYWSEIQDQINDVIEKPKEKDKIFNIANLTFEFLVGFGYEKGTIYHFVNSIFFNRNVNSKIKDLEYVNNFLDKFDLKRRKYEVYFSCSKLFSDISDSCSNFNVEIIEEKASEYSHTLEKKFFKNHQNRKSFIKCKEIMAYDYLNAMMKAEERVSLISDLFVLFHHKKKPWFSTDCLIYNHKKENVIKATFGVNSMSKLNEGDIEHAKKIFPIFLKQFSLRPESFKRFNRGVELHAHSLESNEPSSQILNLWICLEALLITGKGTHISSVESAVNTILINYYLKERLTNFHDLLERWNKDLYSAVSEKLPEEWREDDDCKVLALIGVPEFKDLAMELLAEMDSTPLLRYKFMCLVRDFQDTNRLLKIMSARQKSTEYDIRRIYRTRNKIVHQGALDSKNSRVVEIAHFYLDTVMNTIIYNSLVNDDINSIDNFLFEQGLLREEHKSIINEATKQGISTDNIKRVILGPDS